MSAPPWLAGDESGSHSVAPRVVATLACRCAQRGERVCPAEVLRLFGARMTTSSRWCRVAGVAGGFVLILVAAPVHAKSEADERAAKRVEAMASFLAKAPRLSVTADTSYDVVQTSGQKIEFGELRTITLRRPDRARIDTVRRD